MSLLSDKRIFVTGHQGMVGSAIVRLLRQDVGTDSILLASRSVLDLTHQQSVEDYFRTHRPQVVIFAAAKVGGIHANNSYPADFIRDNLLMASHVIDSAYRHGTRRLLFLGSTCIYPRLSPQPIAEDSLLTGPLESTNEAYAIAKIAGLKMCQFYRKQFGVTFHSAMPTNLYGPGDNYHPQNSHVLPAMIRRFHDAKSEGADSVTIWGTGQPRREFLHVDDLARAVKHLVTLDNPPDWLNVGTGSDVSIADLARLVAKTVGFAGRIEFDTSKPDGTPVKRTDIRRIEATGWAPKIDLQHGLQLTYRSFLEELTAGRLREV